MDKLDYDRPDDTKGTRALIFLGLAIAVVTIFYFGYYA